MSEGLCGVDRFWNTGIGHGPQRIGSDQGYSKEFRGGIEQKREAQEVQSGLESGLMGICREKDDSHFFGLSGSLHKLDHVSKRWRIGQQRRL